MYIDVLRPAARVLHRYVGLCTRNYCDIDTYLLSGLVRAWSNSWTRRHARVPPPVMLLWHVWVRSRVSIPSVSGGLPASVRLASTKRKLANIPALTAFPIFPCNRCRFRCANLVPRELRWAAAATARPLCPSPVALTEQALGDHGRLLRSWHPPFVCEATGRLPQWPNHRLRWEFGPCYFPIGPDRSANSFGPLASHLFESQASLSPPASVDGPTCTRWCG